MKALFDLLSKIANTSLTCVLQGETGVGKEVIARAIVAESDRASKPLVVVDCSSIAENLVDAELLGHDKGAFTDATKSRAGAFEVANGGTVLLDEIGELPPALQPKPLRVLDRREVRRIGSEESILLVVKTISNDQADDPERRTMFLDEARILNQLNHPSIAHLFGEGEAPLL